MILAGSLGIGHPRVNEDRVLSTFYQEGEAGKQHLALDVPIGVGAVMVNVGLLVRVCVACVEGADRVFCHQCHFLLIP